MDYSPLIHWASGSWTLNSGLNKSSTVILVSLPAWLSAEKQKKHNFNLFVSGKKIKNKCTGYKFYPLIKHKSSFMHPISNQTPALVASPSASM